MRSHEYFRYSREVLDITDRALGKGNSGKYKYSAVVQWICSRRYIEREGNSKKCNYRISMEHRNTADIKTKALRLFITGVRTASRDQGT
jgi:hypothetical protein